MCFAIKASCVCVCGPLLLTENPQNPQTKRPEFYSGFDFSEQGAEGPSLVPQPTKTTSDRAWKRTCELRGGGCTWVFVTAGGRHDEFLGPSWQLESSPLTSTKHVLKKATPCGAKIRKKDRPPLVSRLDW